MRTSASTKAIIVVIPAGLWLTHGDASLGRSLALAVGAALVVLAWMMFTARRDATPAPAAQAADHTFEDSNCIDEQRIARTPTGRSARDVRCAASGARARARRSTRR